MKQYRVTFICTGLAYGGAETQLVRLAKRLKVRGWSVSVISLTSPKAYVEELETAGIPVVSLGIRRKLPDPRPILQLIRFTKTWQPHIVHSFMVHANLLARIVRLLVHVPVLICSARSIYEGGWLRELLYRWTDPLCDITTQVSRVGAESYVRKGIVSQHKIRYIPNGVDINMFRPDPKARLQYRAGRGVEGHFVWLAVGRIDVPKDYPTMLRAFAQVVAERSDAILLIAGDGPQRSVLQEFVHRLGLEKQVVFLSIHKNIPQLMNAADAYVMSSAWEGMPNALLEAHASGLPVVATNVGGNSEIVIDGKTGFLVPPKNPEALAQAMIRLMELPEEERQIMGKLARQHIEANFSLDRIVDVWESLYLELLEKKGLLRGS